MMPGWVDGEELRANRRRAKDGWMTRRRPKTMISEPRETTDEISTD